MSTKNLLSTFLRNAIEYSTCKVKCTFISWKLSSAVAGPTVDASSPSSPQAPSESCRSSPPTGGSTGTKKAIVLAN